VRTLSPSPTTVFPGNSLAPAPATCPLLPTRSHFGANVSQRRRLASRAGSPTYWAPRLAVPPSGHKTPHGTAVEAWSDPTQTHYAPGSALRDPLPYSNGPHISPKGTPSSPPLFRPGKRHSASRNFAIAKANPTRGLSSYTRTPPSEPYTATAGTPAFQRANMNTST
jgi:hypothetical protein